MTDRRSLELAADLTLQSAALPAIATCTWCESTAEAICVARSRCIAVVRFVDHGSGEPLGEPWPVVGVASRPENRPLVEALRGAAGQNADAPDDDANWSNLESENDCMVAAVTLEQDAPAQDPALSLLACIGGRSALLASAVIDPARRISLRVIIAESAASEDSPFTGQDAEALRAAMRQITHRAQVAFASAPGVVIEPLNNREVTVLESLACGKTIREIAGQMHRSTHTIHDYLKSMHRKVGVGCRAELIARAAGRCEPRQTENVFTPEHAT